MFKIFYQTDCYKIKMTKLPLKCSIFVTLAHTHFSPVSFLDFLDGTCFSLDFNYFVYFFFVFFVFHFLTLPCIVRVYYWGYSVTPFLFLISNEDLIIFLYKIKKIKNKKTKKKQNTQSIPNLSNYNAQKYLKRETKMIF